MVIDGNISDRLKLSRTCRSQGRFNAYAPVIENDQNGRNVGRDVGVAAVIEQQNCQSGGANGHATKREWPDSFKTKKLVV